ncbi:MAG: hypothetical protein RL154_460 [Pseudomonadota bacterium]
MNKDLESPETFNAVSELTETDICEKYQKTVINLLVLQLKIFGASKSAIAEALAPLKQ